jgi:hypothetical protein
VDAQFVTKLRFEDDSDNAPDGKIRLILTEDLVYLSKVAVHAPGKVGKIVVPAGFVTDLASIPQVLWNILPPIGKYDKAAVVHDFLYQRNGVTRLTADDVLLEGMNVCNVPGWKKYSIYSGVRVGGWVTWNKYRAQDKKAA